MIIRVWDCETTGIPPDGEVVEVAFCDVSRTETGVTIDKPWYSLIDPGFPIPPEASGVHHIVDADVRGCPKWVDVRQKLYGDDVIAYCAHNAAFEKQFFDSKGKPWIDTYKVALKLYPDAPNHKNQTLRYYLGLDEKIRQFFSDCAGLDTAPFDAHRAAGDAIVTAYIFSEMLKHLSPTEMGAISRQPGILPRVPLNAYYSKPWSEPPTDYLNWIIRTIKDKPDVVYSAQLELERRLETEDPGVRNDD